MPLTTSTNATETAASIAIALGQGWHAEDGGWGNGQDAWICGPNGERVHLLIGRYGVGEGRAELSGSLSREQYQEMPYGEKLPSITVTLSKTPEQIARDLERRLLPKYREILTLVTERKERTDAAEIARQELAAQLAATLGESTIGRGQTLYLGRYGDPLDVEVDVRSASSGLEFKLRVVPELAVVLAQAIATVRRGAEATA